MLCLTTLCVTERVVAKGELALQGKHRDSKLLFQEHVGKTPYLFVKFHSNREHEWLTNTLT